jgi:hypothetical protein
MMRSIINLSKIFNWLTWMLSIYLSLFIYLFNDDDDDDQAILLSSNFKITIIFLETYVHLVQ